jgi:hypothetical protein
MSEIKNNNLDDQHEGQVVIDSLSDGSLDEQNEGKPVILTEIPEDNITIINIFIIN